VRDNSAQEDIAEWLAALDIPKVRKNKMRRKTFSGLAVDGLMIFSVLLAIANKLTENRVHEFIGIFMFLLFLVHNILNWKWYVTIRQGKYNIRRSFNFAVNILLLVAIATLMRSSILISCTLFSFLDIKSNLILRQVHITAAYWFFILMSVHLGVHLTRFSTSLKKMIPVLSIYKIHFVFKILLAIIAVVYGGIVFFDRDIFSRLFMLYAFDFWDFNQSVTKFFMNYLAIIAAFAIITHNILKFLNIIKKQRRALN